MDQQDGDQRFTKHPTDDPETVYNNHSAKLRSYLLGIFRNRELVDDVLQTVFRKYTEQRQQGAELTPSWLYRVGYNEAIQHHRGQERLKKNMPGLAWFRQQRESLISTQQISEDEIQIIQNQVNSLPEDLQQIIRLRFEEDLKFKDIAKTLNLPLGTVLTRTRRALAILRTNLNSLND